MFPVFIATFKGVVRDRVLRGILATGLLFLALPQISSLSMRQVTELSITLSLGLFSFILLLLAVFLGATSLWKDFERRYTFSVMGLPLSRGAYLLGKYAGVAGFTLIAGMLLGVAVIAVVWITSSVHPSVRPVAWGNLALAMGFDVVKYLLLLGFAFFFSTVSTSFFLPVFGTIAVYMAGSVSQQVFDYLQTESGQLLPAVVRKASLALYYLLPNFGAFDLRLQAIYGLDLSPSGLLLTLAYAFIYLGILMAASVTIFRRRELL
jgi:ABC-type transport system involved in multi-copper enzyme maturation permease subunit